MLCQSSKLCVCVCVCVVCLCVHSRCAPSTTEGRSVMQRVATSLELRSGKDARSTSSHTTRSGASPLARAPPRPSYLQAHAQSRPQSGWSESSQWGNTDTYLGCIARLKNRPTERETLFLANHSLADPNSDLTPALTSCAAPRGPQARLRARPRTSLHPRSALPAAARPTSCARAAPATPRAPASPGRRRERND